jgi:hypothetical protein
MGCCQVSRVESEITFTQLNSITGIEAEERFNEIPLSSQPSPLKFELIQEERQNSTVRMSYEATNFSNNNYLKTSLEMAFIYGKT